MRKKAMDHIVAITKNDKQELKTHKVNLSLMVDIEDALGRGFAMEEFVEEQLDIAQEAMTKARDIRRFDMNDAYVEAEGYIDEAEAALKDLGLDNNQDIKDFKKQLEDLEKLMDDLEQRQDRIG
jgi:ribosomal protein L13E